MARRNRRKTVVPDARAALDQFKQQLLIKEGVIQSETKIENISYEVAKEINVPLSKGYNGNLSTQDAGKVGGQIGGRMVKELVRMAQEMLVDKNK